MTPWERILYTEICAYLRQAIRLAGETTAPLRNAESRIAGVISMDSGMKCTDEAAARSAWNFARRYAAESRAAAAGLEVS